MESVLTLSKKGKEGDFRVQDDFGGTVHHLLLTTDLVELAEMVINLIQPKPLYGMDILRNDTDQWMVSEVELIEPELWFRTAPNMVKYLAIAIHTHIQDHHENHRTRSSEGLSKQWDVVVIGFGHGWFISSESGYRWEKSISP